jgi:hypothetical protein
MFGYLKVHMTIRTAWISLKRHGGFPGSTITFLYIAAQASSHNIVPVIKTTSGAWQNMIYGQIAALYPTVLAYISITVQDIAA